MKTTTKSLAETHALARTFVAKLLPAGEGATVLGLYGNLGAGKTAFMQGVAAALGVNEAITSPTFVLEKVYRLTGQKFTHLVHIDAYRLEGPEELPGIGWDEVLKGAGNLVCVEWAERVEDAMPSGTRRLRFQFVDDVTREITIEE